MPRQETAAHALSIGVLSADRLEPAEHGQTWMRQSVAFAGRCQQQRGAAVDFQIGGVGRQL